MRIRPDKPEWLKKRLWQRWQVIRRHPTYIDFCTRHTFHNQILSEEHWFKPETEEIRKLFGLELVYEPTLELTEDDFLTSPIFQGTLAVVYETRMVADNDEAQERTTIWDGHYIKLKIDIGINRKKEQILSEVEEFIESSRIEAGILNPGEKEPDKRLTIDQDTFRVWDLHRQGKRPMEIIKALWPKEFRSEVSNSLEEQDQKYELLSVKYRKAGVEDWDRKAFEEAYGKASGVIGLYVRVRDKLRRMKRLMEEFETT